MSEANSKVSRRWLAPEVVQTSSMDCGPAALKCLLEGFHIPVSYGRLREACQTDVDGTSIDTIEVVANQLGMLAEQAIVPADHLFLVGVETLPAVVVVRHGHDEAHFVVVWRKHGNWLQVMDPASGRRWVRVERFADEMLSHRMQVPESQWRTWAGSEDFLRPLRLRMAALGMTPAAIEQKLNEVLTDKGWFSLGALDAVVRMIQSLVEAGGATRGTQAASIVEALHRQTCTSTDDIYGIIPPAYWTVSPDYHEAEQAGTEYTPGEMPLLVGGAVLLRIAGRRADAPPDALAPTPALSQELAAALSEKPDNPLHIVWNMLREDGLLAPLALIGAMAIASGALALEALLFRGLFDMSALLALPGQRLGAVLALLAFMSFLLLIQVPVIAETLRHARHLETRLRVALLKKLPRLNDRYFQSRPVSDMAERSHSIYAAREVPGMGLQLIQALFELVLTFVGIVLIAPGSVALAFALLTMAIVVPLAVQPLLNERDLRVRNQAGALHGFYLDALLGLVPIRAHRAEHNVQRQHEGLLVEWVRSCRGWIRMSLAADAVQALLCLSLAGWLLIRHFSQAGSVSGGDLLLVFWTLKLPALGTQLSGFAHQYPAQRNALLRLLEPLAAPEDARHETGDLPGAAPTASKDAAASMPHIAIENGNVLAAGHAVLSDVNLSIRPGEHVAIVGVSGAGKSTLLGLLLGWHRLSTGTLQVEGVPLIAEHLDAVRRHTAWVDPGIQIWNRSFLENLEYAAGDDELGRIGDVIQAATLRGVLQKLPDGLQTVLGEGGAMLSGGEGQRVRLARALLSSRTRLALLDEPFRGLDRSQRKVLLAEARHWWRDVTLLCVTHDVGETRAFDRVLVVEDGRIVEDGSPAVLAAGPSRYSKLLAAEVQLQRDLWEGPHWRHVRVQDGHIATMAGDAA